MRSDAFSIIEVMFRRPVQINMNILILGAGHYLNGNWTSRYTACQQIQHTHTCTKNIPSKKNTSRSAHTNTKKYKMLIIGLLVTQLATK